MCCVNSTEKSSRQIYAFSAKSAAAHTKLIKRSRMDLMFAVMDFDTIRLYVCQHIQRASDSRRHSRDSGLRNDRGDAGNAAAAALRALVSLAGTEQRAGSGAGARVECGFHQRRAADR